MPSKTFEIPPLYAQAYEAAKMRFAAGGGNGNGGGGWPDPSANITGIDVGLKFKDGAWTDELALRFFVREKKSRGALALSGEPMLPQELMGVRTDVIPAQFNPVRSGLAAEQQARRENPIQPGISVSHGIVGAGTLGSIVYCNENRAPALLSCWHVLAHEAARKGDPVYQPSPVDGGDPRFDAVGFLERWIADEDGDAAIAVLNRSRMVGTAQRVSNVTVGAARRVKVGETLEKVGRGTGRTQAWVDGVGRYQVTLAGGRRIWLEGFRLVPVDGKTEISAQGDSGALWYSRAAGGVVEGVGLHINGEVSEEEGEHAIACHLETVLRRLDVSLAPAAARSKQVPAVEREKVYAWVEQNWDKLAALVAAFPQAKADYGSSPEAAPGAAAPRTIPEGSKPNGKDDVKIYPAAAKSQGDRKRRSERRGTSPS